MNNLVLKEELVEYINHADSRFVETVYDLMKADKLSQSKLSAEHIEILKDRLQQHSDNINSGSSWEEVKNRLQKAL